MTHPTPKEEGYYWALFAHEDTAVMEIVRVDKVYFFDDSYQLKVYCTGSEDDYDLDQFNWLSPSLSPPEVPP